MAQGKKLNCTIISNGTFFEITTKHPIYTLRYVIMTRCYNASKNDYKYYQGKGIKLCDDWKNNPISFFQWCFDNGWKKGMVLDRIDNSKDYDPSNCKFITAQENLSKMHSDNIMIGEKAPHAILTEIQVREIKNKISQGITLTRIANDYKVSKSAIGMIKRGKNWKHVI